MSFNSKEYWENRYKVGGNSGNGSYGEVAKEKTRFLTEFIKRNNIKSLIEYGCGDGNNLLLTSIENPSLKITGVDVSETAIKLCKEKMPNHNFSHKDEYKPETVDLVVSLEVIFHLIEDDVFDDYMDKLTSIRSSWLIILSPDKNDNNFSEHVRTREYTKSKYLNNRYELVEEFEFGENFDCFSSWKIFKSIK